MRLFWGATSIAVAIALAPTAVAAQNGRARPEILANLTNCRALTNDAERLRCFDRNIATLDDAERKQEVVVLDRAEINRTRRSLFGLTLPSLKLFGNGDRSTPDFTTIDTTLKSAQRGQSGWIFVLEDGARWIQTDSSDLARLPTQGDHIRIRKAAMGSFLANIEKQVAIRVRRIN